jgi:hypothetical protein
MRKSSRFLIISFLSFVFSLCAVLVISSVLPNLTSAFAQSNNRCPNEYIFKNFIGKFLPRAAFVNCIQGDPNKVIFRDNRKRQTPVKVGEEFSENRRRLGIQSDKNTGATLGLVSQSHEKINNLVAAGFSEFESWYRFPCDATGNSTFGWYLPGQSQPACPKLTYKQGRNKTIRIGPSAKSLNTKSAALKNFDLGGDDPFPIFGADVNARQYCSASARSGSGWGYHFTSNTREENVCQLAIENCKRKTADTCVVTNQGSWRDYDPEANKLNILLQCSSRPEPYYRQGEGEDVYKLVSELEKEAKDATSCVLYIYNNDEVLVSPQIGKRTLIHTEITKDGFIIDGLAGEAEIVASKHFQQDKPVITTLKVGERYSFTNETDKGETDSLSPEERAKIVDLPVVKMFLDLNNWSDDKIRSEIRQYREALKQFYQPPAVRVEDCFC